ncbi:MAG: acyltransferase [Salibacteraceae bacterium]
MSGQRNLGLDVVRFIAIYCVLIDHGGLNPFGNVLLGGLGVEVFFVLSGYLIGRIILRNFEAFEGFKTIKDFWINRWFRTIPLYFLALAVQIMLSGKFEWGYLYYFVFLQNNFYGISLFPVSWSLVIEEWFYLLLPFLLLIIITLFKRVQLRYLLGVIALMGIVKYILIDGLNIPFTGVNGNIVLRIDTMLIGVCLALIDRQFPEVFQRLASKRYFIIGVGCTVIWQFTIHNYYGLEAAMDSVLMRTLYFPLQSLFIGLTLPYFKHAKVFNHWFKQIPGLALFITWSSILSYSFYLFHQNIFHFLLELDLELSIFWVALACMYPLSYVLYVAYEKPLTQLRARFTRKSP